MTTEPMVRDETVTLDGLRFHYRDWGDPDAPPLVLLHAYLQHARTWDTVATGLADRFRVLALDQRGFGESEWAADYHELRLVADRGGVRGRPRTGTFSLVGFSIGGSAAITYAQLYPDRVERLVAFECFTDPDVAEEAPYRQTMLAHLQPPPLAARDVFERWRRRWRRFARLRRTRQRTNCATGCSAASSSNPDGRWTLALRPDLPHPRQPARAPERGPGGPRRRMAGVRCATLLLAGEESWMVEPTQRVVTRNPQARMATVPQAGHWVPLDNPHGFLGAVSHFLNEAR